MSVVTSVRFHELCLGLVPSLRFLAVTETVKVERTTKTVNLRRKRH